MSVQFSPPAALLERTRREAGLRRPLFATPIGTGLAMLLSACSNFSPNGGLDVAADVARRELRQEVVAIRSRDEAAENEVRVSRLLRRPLTPSAAVEIALRSNRGLQAAYNRLGVAEAIKVRESLPPNPNLSIGRIAGSLSSELEAAIAADILALVTLPARAEIAADRFEAAQLEAAEATLRVAAEARRSYYRAVAAREEARVLEQAAAAAEVAAKLARELGETGAINRLDQARDQLFHAEMAAKLTAARQNEITERERLARALGLWGDDLQFKLPSELPRLPQRPLSLPNVERDAVEQRVDLEAGRKELSALTKAMGLASSTRLLNLFQLSALGKITRENVGSDRVQFNEVGPGATIEAPIFDLGETRVRESEERWLEAVNLLAEKAVNVRSQAREAYSNYRAAHEIALRHQREITPLHATISEETLKRYNTMLVDVFALLEEARRRVLAAAERVEARRNFWLAEVNLRGAIVGGGVFPAEESDAKASAADKASDYP